MFVARLLTALKTPQTHLGMLDDALVLDVDLYRAALLHLVRRLSEEGAVDAATAEWTFTCIADGWVDEHLANVRDGLLELGAVQDQAHLDRLLLAATHQILGCGPGTPAHGLGLTAESPDGDPTLSAADALLLQTVTQATQAAPSDLEPLGLRLLVRRYALELGLLCREEGPALVSRTPLGDAVLALPQPYVLPFLLALEMQLSGGPTDRWRTPRAALAHMQALPQFFVATTGQARRTMDPAGLVPWRRIRRLHLLGVCEPVLSADGHGEREADDAGRVAYAYRLSTFGAAAVAQVLRQPPVELVTLAESLLAERAHAAVEPLLRRSPVMDSEPAALAAIPLPIVEAPAVPATPSNSAEVPWRIEGPLAAIPASATALAESMLGGSLLLDGTPSSGPAGEGRARQEIDLGTLLRRAWEELRVQRVHFSLLGPTVHAVGDRRVLLQAFRELLRSAADAALQGSHTPPLVTVELDPSPEVVQILVHDSGPPLTHGDAAALDVTVSRTDPGVGQGAQVTRRGLWLAHRALTEQGAQIGLSTPQLGGTTVRVTLPRSPRSLRSAA